MPKPPIELIRRALEEDGAETDITTLCTVPAEQQVRASIITRQAGVIAGLAIAAMTFRELDPDLGFIGGRLAHGSVVDLEHEIGTLGDKLG